MWIVETGVCERVLKFYGTPGVFCGLNGYLAVSTAPTPSTFRSFGSTQVIVFSDSDVVRREKERALEQQRALRQAADAARQAAVAKAAVVEQAKASAAKAAREAKFEADKQASLQFQQDWRELSKLFAAERFVDPQRIVDLQRKGQQTATDKVIADIAKRYAGQPTAEIIRLTRQALQREHLPIPERFETKAVGGWWSWAVGP